MFHHQLLKKLLKNTNWNHICGHLQKVLAKEITVMVHSEEEYNSAVEASEYFLEKVLLNHFQS